MTQVEGWLYDDVGPYKYKDPNATLDYEFDFTDWLGTDTIQAATVTVSSEGTKVSDSFNNGVVVVWVSGGVVGATISVSAHVTTTGGRIDDRTFRLKVIER